MRFELVHENAKLPTRGSDFAAGLDLYTPEKFFILPKTFQMVPLGIKGEIPPGWMAMLKARSSLGAQGVDVFAGVIDSDYRGEWKVILYNSNISLLTVDKGDRVAQAVILPCYMGDILEGKVNETIRGEAGFGSTGK